MVKTIENESNSNFKTGFELKVGHWGTELSQEDSYTKKQKTITMDKEQALKMAQDIISYFENKCFHDTCDKEGDYLVCEITYTDGRKTKGNYCERHATKLTLVNGVSEISSYPPVK